MKNTNTIINIGKKALAISSVALLAACSTVHNKGIDNSIITKTDVEVRPLETSIKVGERVTGTATCTQFLGITLEGPEKESYGATLQTNEGNVAGGKCTRGAIYKALSGTDADLILAPQYELESSGMLCIPVVDFCLYKSSTVVVKGYAGKYTTIKEMSPDVVRSRQMNKKGSNSVALW